MAETTRLLDAYGQPVSLAELRHEHAAPQVAGIRTLWTNSVASGLTPQRLAAILQGAVEGDALDYLTLAEEIEERNLHYGSVLSTRKLAVAGLEATVEAASDDSRDVEFPSSKPHPLAAPSSQKSSPNFGQSPPKGATSGFAVREGWQHAV